MILCLGVSCCVFFRVFGVSLSRYVCANVNVCVFVFVCVFLCKIVCVKKRVSMCE